MKILISNDDGIDAEGIYRLAEAMSEIGEVIIIAPKTEQSAAGHSITMKIPLRISKYKVRNKFKGYAINGTPADCVKIGITHILKELPDIVISGINHGSNTAISIIYSGTVSAAREAAILGCPAIAVSVTDHNPKHFDAAANFVKELALKVIKNKLPEGIVLNVNVPNIPKEEIKGILPTHQGKSKWDDGYEERVDPYGNNYYWLTGKMADTDEEIHNDQVAVQNNYISVTPIHFDLTDYKVYEELKSWNLSEIK